jgi:hypothetical protein
LPLGLTTENVTAKEVLSTESLQVGKLKSG